MQIAVTFRHMEADEGIKEYVKGKVEKLQKYIENPQEVHVILSTEKFRRTAEITIIGDGMTLNSQARNSDLYAAIDQMVDKMERRIRGRREKAKRKRPNVSPSKPTPPLGEEIFEGSDEVGPPPIIQRRHALAKPMSPEEAVAQLNLSGQEILFFVNSNSGQMNALYRNKEGGYEWVEPRAE